MRTSCVASAAVLTGILLVGDARAQTVSVDDVVEYRSDRVHVVAAPYHYQGAHDPRWLLIDVGIDVRSGGPLTVERRDFYIVRPDGVELPLASQREYRQSRAELLPMLLALHDRKDPIRDFFPGGDCESHNLRFFVRSGIRQTLADTSPVGPCLRDDLFFAAPTGAWNRGTYILVIGGDTDVRLPIEIH